MQAALRYAAVLGDGPRRTRSLSVLEPTAPRILLRDVYGWFERVKSEIYHRTPAGIAAIAGRPRPAAIPGPTG
jgi:hypothetical protein